MTNLSQKHSSAMQAHKDLPKLMKGAWAEGAIKWNPLRIFLAILTFGLILPFFKSQSKAETKKHNDSLVQQFQALPIASARTSTEGNRGIGSFERPIFPVVDKRKIASHTKSEGNDEVHRSALY